MDTLSVPSPVSIPLLVIFLIGGKPRPSTALDLGQQTTDKSFCAVSSRSLSVACAMWIMKLGLKYRKIRSTSVKPVRLSDSSLYHGDSAAWIQVIFPRLEVSLCSCSSAGSVKSFAVLTARPSVVFSSSVTSTATTTQPRLYPTIYSASLMPVSSVQAAAPTSRRPWLSARKTLPPSR